MISSKLQLRKLAARRQRAMRVRKISKYSITGQMLMAMASSLEPGGYLCRAAPMDVREIGRETGLEPIEYHEQRVHRSMVRRIHVFRKVA